MASLDNLEIGAILKIKDTSFLREEHLKKVLQDAYAVVLEKDYNAQTIKVRSFNGLERWIKVSRVTDSLEIIEF
ncbi:MAG: hypothetical protein PHC62_06855 [Candidatus Izemoplasmatales bacterium]|nr:hypothetical protein [Candidatus Izemoplasmatales bacterium]